MDFHAVNPSLSNGTWVLDLAGNGYDATDRILAFGLPGDKAVAGDWNGDGVDTVGVYRSGQWYFDRDGNGYDSSDAIPVAFGLSSDSPVPGDWNGDGKDTPGIFRQGTWDLDLTGNGYDNGDPFLPFGLPNDQPIAGDWDGDGRDSPAVLQNNNWYFDLEGNGYTGEVPQPNRLGGGVAVAGSARRIPEVDVEGIVDGQSNAVSFGTVAIGAVLEKDFKVRNLGSGTLTLGAVQVPSGFALVAGPTGMLGLPSSLAPLASATFRVRMNTTSGGSRTGTIQFTNNDADESPYNFVVSGNVVAVSSNFGTVLSWQRVVGSTGVLFLKSVKTYGAEGNNIRLYGDFYSLSGSHIRSEVPIGDFNLYGNQAMPQVAVIDNGRFAIAWRNTNITRTGGIHYAIVDAFGATIGSRDQTANITFSPNLDLTSIVPSANGGFRISWRDSITKIAWRRDFTSVGSPISGEVRI